MDDGMIKTIISYENDAGEVTEVETQIPLYVTEEMMDDMDYMPVEDVPEQSSRLPLVLGIVAAVIVAVVIVVILIVHSRKKKKAKRQQEEDLAELLTDEDEGKKGE